MRRQDTTYNFPIFKMIGVLMISAALVSACDDDENKQEQPPVTDIDGNEYKTVAIGSQIWMAENLKVVSFNDGSGTVKYVNSSDDLTAITTAAGTFYEDNGANGLTYGILYNWYAIASGKLCPTGWHVPNDSEWKTLIDFLGGEDVAGGKMKETGTTHWNAPNQDATNSSGFTARPAGYLFDNGNYNSLGNVTHWWTSTESGANEAFDRYVYFQNGKAVKGTYSKQVYYSCRCVKN